MKKTTWKPVIIESPFKGNADSTEADHRTYLERCIRHCIQRGETPYASHKMLTDALDDHEEEERKIGMEAGMAMSNILLLAGATPIFYEDYGLSGGMFAARNTYNIANVAYHFRKIGRNP